MDTKINNIKTDAQRLPMGYEIQPNTIKMLEEKLKMMHSLLHRGFLENTEIQDKFDRASNSTATFNKPKIVIKMAKVTSIRYRKSEDIRQAMHTFLVTVHRLKTPFFYLLTGKEGEVELLLGLYDHEEYKNKLENTFQTFLTILPGFLPGCELKRLEKGGEKLLEYLDALPNKRVITGIPAEKDKREDKQTQDRTIFGIEQLADAMPEHFAVLTVACPVSDSHNKKTQEDVSRWHDFAHGFVKITEQIAHAEQEGTGGGTSLTEGKSDTKTSSESAGQSLTKRPNLPVSILKLLEFYTVGGAYPQSSENRTVSDQTSTGVSSSATTSSNWQKGSTDSIALTLEHTNKQALYLEELLGRLHKRLDVGTGVGMWRTVTEVYADKPPHVEKAAQILAGLLAGSESSLDPIRIINVPDTVDPFGTMDNKGLKVIDSHPLGQEYQYLSTLLTSNELAHITMLPIHELPGLPVEKLTDYGRSQIHGSEDKSISIGYLVDREIETKRQITISTSQLQRHCFVTGATGSGKSNTMRGLLTELWNDQGIPFLVIEPVKREYRGMQSCIKGGMRIFTLGKGYNDFSINPFDFEPVVGLVPHIDHLKAAFNASLGTYSSMPFILEDIIYRVYEQYGWNLESGENRLLYKAADALGEEVPSKSLRNLFLPRLSDMIPLVEESIQKFFPSITDYGGSLMGALRARLSSMTRGAKGALLNQQHSVSFRELLSKPCILELSPFADNDEKSFVMALILMRLYEYRQSEDLKGEIQEPDRLRHLLVIEEAHRLLSKPNASGEHTAQSRQKGVEVFADVLSEIRSYGQGIVIVDQIPSKLIPDVLRNTDVKIAHRLVDREDRQVLGATMNLDDDQLQDLAKARTGQASVYFGGLRKALRVQVSQAPLGPGICDDKDPHLVREYFSAFGGIDIDFDVMRLKREPDISMALAVGYLTIALTEDPDIFKGLREEACSRIKEMLKLNSDEHVWPALVPGFYKIREQFIVQGIPMYLAAYMTIVSASVLRAWLKNEINLNDRIKCLTAENKGLGLLYARQQCAVDLLQHLIGIRLQGKRSSFQEEVERGLRYIESQKGIIPLKEILANHSNELVMKYTISEAALNNLILRHLCSYKTDNDELRALAGVATNELRNTLTLAEDIA